MLSPREIIESPLLFIMAVGEESPADEADDDSSLIEVAEREREYLRNKLREQLQREPSDEEEDEWLRQHTESY